MHTVDLNSLKGNERKVVETLAEDGGVVFQSEIVGKKLITKKHG